jgi:prepilin-type N-terminal cleavage/methylation domain-containing protein
LRFHFVKGERARTVPNTAERSAAPQAFTLVELLVVVAILSALAAMLMPAVQNAREAARRVECKNNIKQLAIACHAHHDVHGIFPTGGWGWYWVGDADRGFKTEQPGGWIYNTLPYFEQYAIYNLASDGKVDVASRSQRIGAAQIVQTPLSVINCPTRRTNTIYPMTANEGGKEGYSNSITPNWAGRSDYAINAGHIYDEWPDQELGKGPKDYIDAKIWTAAGYWGGQQSFLFRSVHGSEQMTGISYERSMVEIRHVSDGTSHTYLLGEKYVPSMHYADGIDQGDNETWCTGFNNDNYRCTSRLVDGRIVESRPAHDHQSPSDASRGRFGSAHPAAWNVAFCDGSVREMSYEIDWQIHRDLGNRADGAATLSAFLATR